MSGLMGDSWILLSASASNLFQHHMSCSLLKMPRYAHEGMRAKKANEVSRLVLAVCGCCNKWPETRWLAATEVCSLTSLDARSLKSKRQWTLVGGGNPFVLFSSLWWPPALPSSWLCHLSIASIFTPASPLRVCLLRKFLLLYLFQLSITGSAVKNLPAKQETWVPSLGQRGGNSNPFQCSCLENSMGRGAWQAIVYGVSKESDMT